ncbi:hypothetical protein Hanom_Chr07g00631761 [Helianthus anomalus]
MIQLMEKKRKILKDKKQELDEQAALALSEKKLKVMGHTVAPSASEVDLGVFVENLGNLLEQIYDASSLKKTYGSQTSLVYFCSYHSSHLMTIDSCFR